MPISTLSLNALRSYFQSNNYRPKNLQELCREFKARGSQKKKLKDHLLKLQREGTIRRNKKRRFVLIEDSQKGGDRKRGKSKSAGGKFIVGKFTYNPRGFGFVSPETDAPKRKLPNDDIYIPFENLSGAVHGDRVKIRLEQTRDPKRTRGRIVDVLDRNTNVVVGTVKFHGKSVRVRPVGFDFQHIVEIPSPIPEDLRHLEGSEEAVFVACKIHWKKSDENRLVGSLIQILGPESDPKIDTLIAIYRNELPLKYPMDASLEADQLPDAIPTSVLTERKDFRDTLFVTIDGADARDFDDAVNLSEDGTLRVAIADVAHYVKPDSKLDQEAADRGNSYYFPDRVLPMLPEKISNGLCSLRPKEDRLAMVVEVELDSTLKIKKSRIVEGVIHSAARLTYEGVDQAFENDNQGAKIPAPIFDMLKKISTLSQGLFRQRVERGGIDFELSEAKVILDEKGNISRYERRARTPAQSLIEECMLLANKTVALELSKHGYPSVNRVHEKPDPGKLEQFIKVVRTFGHDVSFNPFHVTHEDINTVLKQFKGDPRERIFSYLALRSMKQAYYTPEELGHYGLGFPDYLHFTSPIRRYADLIIHRIVKKLLQKKKVDPSTLIPKNYDSLHTICSQISGTERKAQSAEREVYSLKGIRYMQNRTNETFWASIIGIVARGLFVELEDYPIEGFVNAQKFFEDRYDFFESEMKLKGRRRGKTFRLGDRVRVKVEEASIRSMRLDFRLA